MEDAARKEKLAAAKKKLKKFKKTGKTPNNSPAPPKGENGVSKQDSKSNSTSGKKANGKEALNAHSPLPQTTPSPASVQQSDHSSQEIHSAVSTPANTRPPSNQATTASTERLQQLSRTVNGLINESSAYVSGENSQIGPNNGDISDLEVRNQELASLLENQTQANEQLTRHLNDMKLQTGKLQAGLESERKSFDEKLKLEIGALKEQLQVHIQTIGILVSEKTELSSKLTQNQKIAEQRIEEIEELAGRLKASRQRVADLERNLSSASTSSHKHEKSTKELSKEVDRIKLELYKTNKSNEEYQQQNSELQGKLQKKIAECAKLEDGLIEVRGKLEMTELQVTQLQSSDSQPDVDSVKQIESLLQEKTELTSAVDQYKDTCKQIAGERDQISQQYQDYIEQLQQQSQHLQTQINSLMEERAVLVQKDTDLTGLIEELKTKQSTDTAGVEHLMQEKQELMEMINRLTEAVDDTRRKYDAQVADNSQLSRLVMEKENRIMEMEMSVQQMADQTVDKEELLESMQSDKTALSRAIAQNKELKHQLAELQNGFVKMSNDNMELMTTLTSEQHVAKELASRLSQQEDELKDTREQVATKESQLHELQSNAENNSRTRTASMMSEGDVDGRMAEFTEQAPLLEGLQKELASAQDTINALTNQNSLLRAHAMRETDGNDNLRDNSASHMENMSAAIKQLEAERNQVIVDLQKEQREREELRSSLDKLRTELATQTPATMNGDVINKAQFEALQHAMKQLENKYTKAMRDKADLTDKSETLEHTIMQLQGETETIGEYVALYQQQRTILKERSVEKDNYISHLARDREEMADKLGQLQAAIMQLLQERQMLHPYSASSSQGGATSPAGDATANHVPHPGALSPASSVSPGGGARDKSFGATLDSSQLEDWPDYNSSNSDDSDVSAVEPITGGTGEAAPPSHHLPQQQTHSISSQQHSPSTSTTAGAAAAASGIPREDQTAQRIMSLLTEIGTSHIVDRTGLSYHHFLHCNRCSGQLLNV